MEFLLFIAIILSLFIPRYIINKIQEIRENKVAEEFNKSIDINKLQDLKNLIDRYGFESKYFYEKIDNIRCPKCNRISIYKIIENKNDYLRRKIVRKVCNNPRCDFKE